jgi:aminoglycoside phosphotransferase (APT) family kinase protein
MAYAQQVAAEPDSRIFAVRVLASLCHDQVLLMERVSCAPLTKFLVSASRLGRARCSAQLLLLMEHAGAALRAVHRMPPGAMRRIRGATRADFLAWLDVTGEFFREDVSAYNSYRRFAARMRRAAGQLLDETLPCGPQHNDFAPRNVLVDEENRVAVIDMLDEWHGCVWEDVAHFLVSLAANKAQALSGGWFFPQTSLDEMRLAFLRGYDPQGRVDDRVIRLYEAQISLTKWAAALQQQRQRRGWSKLLRSCPQMLGARCYARYAARNLDWIESSVARRAASASAPLVAGGVS